MVEIIAYTEEDLTLFKGSHIGLKIKGKFDFRMFRHGLKIIQKFDLTMLLSSLEYLSVAHHNSHINVFVFLSPYAGTVR